MYRVYIFPNYLKDKSLILLIHNHCIADGIGSNIMLAKMTDSCCEANFPVFKKFAWYENLKNQIIGFIYIPALIEQIKQFPTSNPKNTNPLKLNKPRSFKNRISPSSKDFSLQDFKQKGKKLGYTFNDILLACWAKSVKLYFDEKAPGEDFGPIGLLTCPSLRDNAEIRN